MLANNLTLDDEEAVQEDLRQLEAEAVRFVLIRPFFVTDLSVQLGTTAGVPLQLPRIPTTVPVSEMSTGASSISSTLYYHLSQIPRTRTGTRSNPYGKGRARGITTFALYSFEYIRCCTFQEGIYRNDHSCMNQSAPDYQLSKSPNPSFRFFFDSSKTEPESFEVLLTKACGLFKLPVVLPLKLRYFPTPPTPLSPVPNAALFEPTFNPNQLT